MNTGTVMPGSHARLREAVDPNGRLSDAVWSETFEDRTRALEGDLSALSKLVRLANPPNVQGRPDSRSAAMADKIAPTRSTGLLSEAERLRGKLRRRLEARAIEGDGLLALALLP